MPERVFRGWPAGFVEFLTELEANNDRDWFKANRARYDKFFAWFKQNPMAIDDTHLATRTTTRFRVR
jgi:uncharacterized protein (DUF2461 family)